MGTILALLTILLGGALLWWALNPESSPWTEGRWRMAVPLVAVVAVSTWTFLLLSDPLVMMAAFFMPHITLGIPVGVAILLGIASKGDPAFKALWKWYGLVLLTIVGAALAMAPLMYVLDHLPPREECRFKVTVAVDTPEGVRTASNVYRVMTNRIDMLGRIMSDRRTMEGGNFALDLGTRGRVDVALKTGPKWGFLHYPKEAFGRLQYERGKTEGRVELAGKLRPEFTGVRDGGTKVLRPEDFEAFFGPGVRFRRVWLEMTD